MLLPSCRRTDATTTERTRDCQAAPRAPTAHDVAAGPCVTTCIRFRLLRQAAQWRGAAGPGGEGRGEAGRQQQQRPGGAPSPLPPPPLPAAPPILFFIFFYRTHVSGAESRSQNIHVAAEV